MPLPMSQITDSGVKHEGFGHIKPFLWNYHSPHLEVEKAKRYSFALKVTEDTHERISQHDSNALPYSPAVLLPPEHC